SLFFLQSEASIAQSRLKKNGSEGDKNIVTYRELAGQFEKISGSPVESAGIRNLVIKREDAVFSLDSGIIYKCPPINNETHALLFIGSGNFQFTPPSEIEQMQLYRFYEKKSLNENFASLFMLFSDSTLKEIEGKSNFAGSEINGSYKKKLKESMDYIFDEDDYYINESAAYIFLEGLNKNFFYSHFSNSEGKPLFFIIDPTEEEDISLMRRFNYQFDDLHETVCQYSSKKRISSWENLGIQNGKIYISEYIIDSKIENDLDFSAHANINFVPSFEEQKWIHLYLFKELKVDSVLWNGNKRAEFFKGEELSSLWIMLDDSSGRNKNYNLDIYYHGGLLDNNELGWVSIKSPDYWFPRCSGREKSKFDLTFHSPSRYKLCSVGKLISSLEEDDMITSRWQSELPIRNASFNIGAFEEYTVDLKNHLKVSAYISKYGRSQMASFLMENEVLSHDNMEEQIAADVVNSSSLFDNIFGKIPLEQIYITEIPYSHGEAFPGLIHLSWTAFQGIEREGDLELFVAHEVAHQWWGIQVDFQTYHDQWLSEAFAEYSALWYMQLALKDNKRFFDELDSWKEAIINNRKYLFGSGQEAGPIWLGHRTQGSETMGDYQLIIYNKGAWVLHMLRNMMINLQTMNEDKFTNMMKDFFNSYSGKKACTQDFQKTVEKHFGQNMNWFFNQWIYQTAIPDYKFSFKSSQLPDGNYKVRCRVVQENVPPEFKMPMDVLIKFENDRFARVRVEVNGQNPEFDLPKLPLEPKEIIFNDLNSVLCNLEYEDW
ncbi:MAG: M1 family aminopeptidase, partial [Ignavibacteria bacterium]